MKPSLLYCRLTIDASDSDSVTVGGASSSVDHQLVPVTEKPRHRRRAAHRHRLVRLVQRVRVGVSVKVPVCDRVRDRSPKSVPDAAVPDPTVTAGVAVAPSSVTPSRRRPPSPSPPPPIHSPVTEKSPSAPATTVRGRARRRHRHARRRLRVQHHRPPSSTPSHRVHHHLQRQAHVRGPGRPRPVRRTTPVTVTVLASRPPRSSVRAQRAAAGEYRAHGHPSSPRSTRGSGEAVTVVRRASSAIDDPTATASPSAGRRRP